MIAELSKEKSWLALMGYKGPHKRMEDRELILRFFACHAGYNEYRPPVKTFLSKQMQELNRRTTESLDDLKARFLNAVRLSKVVFPDHPFQRFKTGDENNHNGEWQRRVNVALFEVVMLSLENYTQRDVFTKREGIQNELMNLMTHNDVFVDSITINSYMGAKFRRRHEIWRSALSDVIGPGVSDRRFFSRQERRNLYEKDKTCHICGQEITEFDDATVDHVQPHSKGGRTTPDNARLAHRFCNSSKGARQPQ